MKPVHPAARHRVAATALLVAGFALAGCTDLLQPREDRRGASGALIAFGGGDGGAAHACAACHGARGEGNGFDAPRLAGLPAGYLQKQLEDHAAGLRPHALMHDVARRLGSAERVHVAGYYAGLPPRALPPVLDAALDPALNPALRPASHPGGTAHPDDAGAALYARACASCHGAAAEGGPRAPPLAGQPAHYLAQQLQDWQAAKRRNDAEQAMLAVAQRLSPGEVSALGRHLAAIPARPAPAGR